MSTKTKQDWKAKALDASRGSQLGAILACALNPQEQIKAPYFLGKATLTSDGFLMCNFVDRTGEGHMGALVCSHSDLCRNARGLAAHLKLNAEDKAALFAAFNGWIGQDYSGRGLGL